MKNEMVIDYTEWPYSKSDCKSPTVGVIRGFASSINVNFLSTNKSMNIYDITFIALLAIFT